MNASRHKKRKHTAVTLLTSGRNWQSASTLGALVSQALADLQQGKSRVRDRVLERLAKAEAERGRKRWWIDESGHPIYCVYRPGLRGPYTKRQVSELTGTGYGHLRYDGKPCCTPGDPAKNHRRQR